MYLYRHQSSLKLFLLTSGRAFPGKHCYQSPIKQILAMTSTLLKLTYSEGGNMQQFLHEYLKKRLCPDLIGSNSMFQVGQISYDGCHCLSLRASVTA